jgi:hypothetical protein
MVMTWVITVYLNQVVLDQWSSENWISVLMHMFWCTCCQVFHGCCKYGTRESAQATGPAEPTNIKMPFRLFHHISPSIRFSRMSCLLNTFNIYWAHLKRKDGFASKLYEGIGLLASHTGNFMCKKNKTKCAKHQRRADLLLAPRPAAVLAAAAKWADVLT